MGSPGRILCRVHRSFSSSSPEPWLWALALLAITSCGQHQFFSYGSRYRRPASQETTPAAASPAVSPGPVEALADAGHAVVAAVVPVLSPKPVTVLREVEIDDGQTFTDLLTAAGIAQSDALAASSALAKVYDPRHLKNGQGVTLTFTRLGAQETLATSPSSRK